MRFCIAISSVFALAFLTTLVESAEIIEIGVVPGGQNSKAKGVSADGKTVTGNSFTPQGLKIFRWTEQEGPVGLGNPELRNDIDVGGISADGNVIVGSIESGGEKAFRWTKQEGLREIEQPAGVTKSEAVAVSADGNVVVGVFTKGSVVSGFKWTKQTGMVDLGRTPTGQYSEVFGISADGKVVTGTGTCKTHSGYCMLRWESSLEDLSNLEVKVKGVAGKGRSLSVDGKTIAGYSTFFNNTAIRWNREEGFVSLGSLPRGDGTYDGQSFAYGISDDGNVIVGSSISRKARAFIWDKQSNQMKDLLPLLKKKKVKGAEDWFSIWNPVDISGNENDGYNIVGQGTIDNRERGFLIRGLKLKP